MASIGAREISLKNSRMKKEKRRRKNCWNNSASHCIYYILWIGDKQKLDTTYASFENGAQTLPRGMPTRILNIRSRVPGVFIRAAANARHRKQNPVCPKGGTRLREIFCRGWLKIGVGQVDACFSPPSSGTTLAALVVASPLFVARSRSIWIYRIVD